MLLAPTFVIAILDNKDNGPMEATNKGHPSFRTYPPPPPIPPPEETFQKEGGQNKSPPLSAPIATPIEEA